MRRRSPIAKSLVRNSKSAMLAAIEIHNKPQIIYRYEIVVLLIINSWELVLKAYIYKYLKSVKLIYPDNTTKPFPECASCVFSNLGKEYLVFKENLDVLYEYRNKIAHFYEGTLDPILFMLVKKNVLFYSQFMNKFFNIDLSQESNLFLLPIGFTPLYSPIDYLSKRSELDDKPTVVKIFLDKLINTSKQLLENGIEESIFADFNISLINVNKIKNADIIVGITSESTIDSREIKINKNVNITSSDGGNQSSILITRDKSKSSGVLMHEELSSGLFKEINNIIEANTLLSPTSEQFYLGEEVYYRIYAEREHVDNEEKNNLLMAQTALNKFYSPGLFWFLRLDSSICASLIFDFFENPKSPNVHTFIRLIFLLGDKVTNWLYKLLDNKWGKHPQPPNYYWTFQDMYKAKGVNERRLLALRMTTNQRLELSDDNKNIQISDLLNNIELASSYLTKSCFDVFNGMKESRSITRILDIIVYGKALEEKAVNIAKEFSS